MKVKINIINFILGIIYRVYETLEAKRMIFMSRYIRKLFELRYSFVAMFITVYEENKVLVKIPVLRIKIHKNDGFKFAMEKQVEGKVSKTEVTMVMINWLETKTEKFEIDLPTLDEMSRRGLALEYIKEKYKSHVRQ